MAATDSTQAPVGAPAQDPPARRSLLKQLRFWQWPALLVITAAAAVADAWGITSGGLEMFYAGGVRSMSANWHDFLYGSFDPSGSITLDKLPGPFWVQALSVRAFGASVWAMDLPQVVWSALTVVVVFFAVRRVAGPAYGLVAAALLAVTPVTLSTAHGNLGDPLFVLLSVLAADAALRAVQTPHGGKWAGTWWLLLAALWSGLAFQAKMSEAWLLWGVFAVVYLVAGPAGLGWRLLRLAVSAPALAVVSLSWMVFAQLTPAGSRPYADGSTDNSFFSQVFSYNGIMRFGDQSAYGLPATAKASAAAVAYSRHASAAQEALLSAYASHPGWDRLLIEPLAPLVGWFLVPALAVAVAGAVAFLRARRGAPDSARREYASLLLWGLWLIVVAVMFSVSKLVQPYYFAILSPAVAALLALGAKAAMDRAGARRWRVWSAAGVAVTALGSAALLYHAGPSWHVAGLAAGAVALVAGGVAVAVAAQGRPAAGDAGIAEAGAADAGPVGEGEAERRARGRVRALLGRVSIAVVVGAALTGPAVADGWEVAKHAGAFDVPLGPGGSVARQDPALASAIGKYPAYGGTVLSEITPAAWQEREKIARENDNVLMQGDWIAVYTSAEAAIYIAGGGQKVLPIGGFTGLVPTPTAGQVSSMIASRQILFALIPGRGDPRFNDPRVQAIVKHCAPIGGAVNATARAQLYTCAPG